MQTSDELAWLKLPAMVTSDKVGRLSRRVMVMLAFTSNRARPAPPRAHVDPESDQPAGSAGTAAYHGCLYLAANIQPVGAVNQLTIAQLPKGRVYKHRTFRHSSLPPKVASDVVTGVVFLISHRFRQVSAAVVASGR